ncbi:MAG: hypothetical protein C0482_23625 [Gordonia sp.]|nr:hypothetical protein [Gordonia sp. (in: high G+C Gram-positive bacteria)]
MQLKNGLSLVSVVDTTNVIVIRVSRPDAVLTCGGAPMRIKGEEYELAAPDEAFQGGSILGKRYVDADGAIEVLCTKGGPSSLALDGIALTILQAKPLPASD